VIERDQGAHQPIAADYAHGPTGRIDHRQALDLVLQQQAQGLARSGFDRSWGTA